MAAPVGAAVPSDKMAVTINNVPATVYGALWRRPIQASLGGAQSPTGVVLSVHQ